MPDFCLLLDSQYSLPLLVLLSAALAEPQRLRCLVDKPTTQATHMVNLALRIDEDFLIVVLVGGTLFRGFCTRLCSTAAHWLLDDLF